MTVWTTSVIALAAALSSVVGAPSFAQEGRAGQEISEAEEAACVAAPEPVVTLSYGSRYTEESEDRSDLDEISSAEVDEALKPVDDFIVELANSANRASSGAEDAEEVANCVVDAIHVWAEAGALSRLETMNAQISAPSRLAGLAMAYLQVKPYASDIKSPHQAVIEDWLEERTLAMMEYFDDDAPQNASRNNLRAWAGFAAAAVSQSTGNRGIADWAAETVELVACQADEDGALPLEMGRGSRALQYQLHAVAPLVVTAAMLSDERRDLFQLCDDAIHRIVGFVPLAFEDPELVNDKAGEEQTYFLGEDELEGFELAWADAYLSRFDSPELAALVETYRPLANSKLGGDQERLW